MKTNVSISLNDTERSILANFMYGKKTKRLATRVEIVALARESIACILRAQSRDHYSFNSDGALEYEALDILGPDGDETNQAETPDPEDTDHLADKSAGHVRGWNQVKHAGEVKKRAARAFGDGA